MPSYRINWTIDVDADNPRKAAEQALAAQRDPASTATVFDVCTPTGQRIECVDLSKPAPPRYCPYCGGPHFIGVANWVARSQQLGDTGNTARLVEYQCEECDNRSFWS